MRVTRRSGFALPLVLVVGCGGTPKTSTPSTNTEATPTEGKQLPESPGTGTVTKTTLESGNVLLTYESGDKIYVHKDGTCHAEYNANCGVSDGPDVEPRTCNPPPPQQVKCPVDAK